MIDFFGYKSFNEFMNKIGNIDISHVARTWEGK